MKIWNEQKIKIWQINYIWINKVHAKHIKKIKYYLQIIDKLNTPMKINSAVATFGPRGV